MAEAQAATDARATSGANAESARGDGPQVQAERATWAAATQTAKQAAEQQTAAAEKAGEVMRDWTSTMSALYSRNMEMASTRSLALAEYLDDLSHARQPADVLNAGTRYWTRMVSDYSSFAVGETGLIKDMMAKSRPER